MTEKNNNTEDNSIKNITDNLYDIIKDEVIKRIYGKYTRRFGAVRYPDEIRNIKYMSDTDFNKK